MIKLALKNLLKEKRRTLLTSSIMAFAIVYYIVVSGLLAGFERDSLKNYISLSTAHIKIYPKKTQKTDYINEMETLENTLKKFSFIKSYTKQLRIKAAIDDGIDQLPVIINGIDNKSQKVFSYKTYVNGGSLNKGIWLGASLAKKFNVKQGDYLFITLNDNGVLISQKMEIKGIINAPYPDINNYYVFMSLSYLQNLIHNSQVSEIYIKVYNYTKADAYAKKMQQILALYNVVSWNKQAATLINISKVKGSSSIVFLFIIILIGIIGTSNTLFISIYEKIREIGTLKAIGISDKEIMKLFLLEGFFLGLFASTTGVIIGAILNYYLSVYGISLGNMMHGIDVGYAVSNIVKNEWQPSVIIFSFLLGPGTTTLASFFPSKKAYKMNPNDCLRNI